MNLLNNKILLAVVASAVVIGGLIVGQSGLKQLSHLGKQNHGQVASNNGSVTGSNEAANGQHAGSVSGSVESNGNGVSGSGKVIINLKDIKNPQSLVDQAKENGPYTCYFSEKNNSVKGHISSDGTKAYVYVLDKTSSVEVEMWFTPDGMYVQDKNLKTREVQRIKLPKAAAAYYEQALRYSVLNQLAKYSLSYNAQGVSIKCYKNKVDIAPLNKGIFKSINLPSNMPQGVQPNMQGAQGTMQGQANGFGF